MDDSKRNNNYGTRHQSSLESKSRAESVIQRIFLAVQYMSIAEGDVRERLVGAIQTISILSVQKFPKHLQNDYDWIMNASMKYKSKYPNLHSDLEETMRKIRRSTGRKIAERLFKLYSDLQDIRGFPLLEVRDPRE